jgi:hypothetical protein
MSEPDPPSRAPVPQRPPNGPPPWLSPDWQRPTWAPAAAWPPPPTWAPAAPPPAWPPRPQSWPSQPRPQLWTPAATQPWAAPAAPPLTRRQKLAYVVAAAVVVCFLGGLALLASGVPHPVPAPPTPPIDAAGSIVYSDEFHNAVSGWYEGFSDNDTWFGYGAEGYVASSSFGGYLDFSMAPYPTAYERLGVSATARADAETAEDAGFGTVCRRSDAKAKLWYEFIVYGDGRWYVGRRASGGAAETGPTTIAQGSGLTKPGIDSRTVEGICSTIDGRTNRIVLLVNGQVVSDVVDTVVAIPQSGWSGGVAVVGSQSGVANVTFTLFELRNLAGTEYATAAGATPAASASVGAGATATPSPAPTASHTPVSPNGGRVAYDTDFATAGAWPVGNLGGSMTATLSAGGYEVTTSASSPQIVAAPRWTDALSLSVSATVVQSVDAQAAGFSLAGFGLVCSRSSGPTQLTYEFVVRADGAWDVDRFEGPPEQASVVHVLSSGLGPVAAPTTETTMTGICTTLGTATQLDFYVNGQLIFDTIDENPGPSFGGWIGGIDVRGASRPHSATLSRFTLTELRP